MTHPKGNLPRVGRGIAKLFVLVAAAAFLAIVAAGPDGAWAQQRPPTAVLNQAKTPTVPKPVNKYDKAIDDVRQGAVGVADFRATGDPAKAVEAAKKLKVSPKRILGPKYEVPPQRVLGPGTY